MSLQSPFLCNLNALTPAERTEHEALSQRMLHAIRSVRELADGYALELDRAQISMKDLGIWTEFEHRCCPFFDFTLEWRRENGPLILRLTGREGVKDFIKAEFSNAIR